MPTEPAAAQERSEEDAEHGRCRRGRREYCQAGKVFSPYEADDALDVVGRKAREQGPWIDPRGNAHRAHSRESCDGNHDDHSQRVQGLCMGAPFSAGKRGKVLKRTQGAEERAIPPPGDRGHEQDSRSRYAGDKSSGGEAGKDFAYCPIDSREELHRGNGGGHVVCRITGGQESEASGNQDDYGRTQPYGTRQTDHRIIRRMV